MICNVTVHCALECSAVLPPCVVPPPCSHPVPAQSGGTDTHTTTLNTLQTNCTALHCTALHCRHPALLHSCVPPFHFRVMWVAPTPPPLETLIVISPGRGSHFKENRSTQTSRLPKNHRMGSGCHRGGSHSPNLPYSKRVGSPVADLPFWWY